MKNAPEMTPETLLDKLATLLPPNALISVQCQYNRTSKGEIDKRFSVNAITHRKGKIKPFVGFVVTKSISDAYYSICDLWKTHLNQG